jgi:hypothetical protein
MRIRATPIVYVKDKEAKPAVIVEIDGAVNKDGEVVEVKEGKIVGAAHGPGFSVGGVNGGSGTCV